MKKRPLSFLIKVLLTTLGCEQSRGITSRNDDFVTL